MSPVQVKMGTMPVFHLLRNNLLCHREQQERDGLADMLNHATRCVNDRLGQLALYEDRERLSHWLPWWLLCLDEQGGKYGGGICQAVGAAKRTLQMSVLHY
jgi:hypothetical protein